MPKLEVRIAAVWLRAQQRTRSRCGTTYALKHLIEATAGRYVSRDDVEDAAKLIGLPGEYPWFRMSARLTLPRLAEFAAIPEAFTHPSYMDKVEQYYEFPYSRSADGIDARLAWRAYERIADARREADAAKAT